MKDISIKYEIAYIINLACNLNAGVTWLVESSITVCISAYAQRLDRILKIN